MNQLEIFARKIRSVVDYVKVSKAVSMLKKEKHLMFIERTSNGINGIVKSQTNKDLEYSVILKENGEHICGTQNLHRCGGLRNGICKHCIMLTMAAVKGKLISAQEGISWLKKSNLHHSIYDKTVAQVVFERFRNPIEAGIEFREVEIVAEDLLAF